MSIGFAHKAIGHLAQAIGSSDTTIVLHSMEYEPVLSAKGSEVYLMLRGPVNRELVKVDIAASLWGGYLTVARGQGGTSAVAWPVGSMLFATTHADHYNAIIQRGENRTIDYNPNEVLSPLFAGEEVYQDSPAGCERWWKAFNDTDLYWDIITGAPCASEGYFDIGWDYPILKSSLTEQTISYYWDAYNAGAGTPWPNNPGNMVNGSTANWASHLGTGSAGDQRCNSISLESPPGGSPTITKVEIRAYAGRGQSTPDKFAIMPVFSGGNGSEFDLMAAGLPAYPSLGWSNWSDITSDTNAPGTWSWTDITNLGINALSQWSTSGPGDSNSIAQIDLRVTYLG